MSTTAEELLSIMSLRLKMQDDGLTNPSTSVKIATRSLVEKLSGLDGKEKIEISIGDDVFAKYIRAATGEVLTEIKLDENT